MLVLYFKVYDQDEVKIVIISKILLKMIITQMAMRMRMLVRSIMVMVMMTMMKMTMMMMMTMVIFREEGGLGWLSIID